MQVVSTLSLWFTRSEIYTYVVWKELTKHKFKKGGNCIDNTHTLYTKWIRLRILCHLYKTTAGILSPESLPIGISLNFCMTSHCEHTFYVVLWWTVSPLHCHASLLLPPSYTHQHSRWGWFWHWMQLKSCSKCTGRYRLLHWNVHGEAQDGTAVDLKVLQNGNITLTSNYCTVLHIMYTVLKFEISVMSGRLTHICTPQQDISIILYEKMVQLHINLIYANSFQVCTNSANRKITSFWQWTVWCHLLWAARCGKNQNSGLLSLS